MNQIKFEKPNYSKTYLELFQLIVFVAVIFYFGQALFVPMFFGLLVAMVLFPTCKWLENHKWPRSLAITVCLSIVIMLFALLLEIFFLQLVEFKKDLPQLATKLGPAVLDLRLWIEESFGFNIDAQNNWLRRAADNLSVNSAKIVEDTVSITLSTLFTLFLIPIYAALFLYNRSAFVRFATSVSGRDLQGKLSSILRESIHTYFKFIKGTVIVYVIVGILNSLGLMALGIEHAILFGMLTAIMTMIPYVGIIVSALLPVSVAWLTKDSIWYPFGVVAVFAVVQYLEANVIFPKVVAAQLKTSTWATLVAIIAGGLLWGVSGMILFVPFVGILKVVSDYIPEWKPLNILLSR